MCMKTNCDKELCDICKEEKLARSFCCICAEEQHRVCLGCAGKCNSKCPFCRKRLDEAERDEPDITSELLCKCPVDSPPPEKKHDGSDSIEKKEEVDSNNKTSSDCDEKDPSTDGDEKNPEGERDEPGYCELM